MPFERRYLVSRQVVVNNDAFLLIRGDLQQPFPDSEKPLRGLEKLVLIGQQLAEVGLIEVGGPLVHLRQFVCDLLDRHRTSTGGDDFPKHTLRRSPFVLISDLKIPLAVNPYEPGACRQHVANQLGRILLCLQRPDYVGRSHRLFISQQGRIRLVLQIADGLLLGPIFNRCCVQTATSVTFSLLASFTLSPAHSAGWQASS